MLIEAIYSKNLNLIGVADYLGWDPPHTLTGILNNEQSTRTI